MYYVNIELKEEAMKRFAKKARQIESELEVGCTFKKGILGCVLYTNNIQDIKEILFNDCDEIFYYKQEEVA